MNTRQLTDRPQTGSTIYLVDPDGLVIDKGKLIIGFAIAHVTGTHGQRYVIHDIEPDETGQFTRATRWHRLG